MWVGPEVETDLLARAKRGDRDAACRLLARHRERVFRLAFRFTGNADDAEDLAQEVLLRAFRGLTEFDGRSSFSTWLYRIALNVCLNNRRQTRKQIPLGEEVPAGPSADPAHAYACRELQAEIAGAIRSLPDGLRTVFILVALEGCSYAEAAGILDLNVEAVRMRMSRARKQLRGRLEDYLNGLNAPESEV